jgi:NAD(P)-dependent dehydrogenase (short-subunit alcohol dehydrogenase family)
MNRVKDKVALVTGGALGLGRSAALLLAREGAKVAVTDVLDAEGVRVVAEIEKQGGAARYFHLDVASEEQWIKAVDDALAAFGRLDVVVNNAGLGIKGNAEETTLAEWRKVMSVNLDGVFLGVNQERRARRLDHQSLLDRGAGGRPGPCRL